MCQLTSRPQLLPGIHWLKTRASATRTTWHPWQQQQLSVRRALARAAVRNMEHGQRKIWIDCDAGVDDAQGIMLAASDPVCRILGISCVFGNTSLQQVGLNVCRVLALCGRGDVPVYLGCHEPLVAPYKEPGYWFGRDGMGDAPHARPQPHALELRPSSGHAAAKLVECAQEHEGQLVVIALGPLTNIALACKLDPSFPSRLHRLYVMGSSEAVGNVTPTAEFNWHEDPEAAHVVMHQFAGCVASGRPCSPVQIISWECTERHPIPWDVLDRWLSKGTNKSMFLAAVSEVVMGKVKKSAQYKASGWESADPLAMAVAIRPDLVLGVKQVACTVETSQSPLTRGMAIYDWHGLLKQRPNVHLINSVNMTEYLRLMEHSLD